MIKYGWIILCCVVFGTYAYDLNDQDFRMIDNVTRQIELVSVTKGSGFADTMVVSLSWLIARQEDERSVLILKNIRKNLMDTMRRKADQELKSTKSGFVATFGSGIISTGVVIPSKCFTYYDQIDRVAYRLNFPTALVVATWLREASCNYYNPGNGDGMFQIQSADYGTGDVTEEIFEQKIRDMINFSKNKWSWYQRSNQSSGWLIDLTYDKLSYTGFYNHMTLYNALSWSIRNEMLTPRNTHYVQGNLYSWSNTTTGQVTDGVMTSLMKILQWEIGKWYW